MASFQDSKVEWLGKIPKHWLIAKLKNQCQIIPSNVDKKSHDDETEVRLCNYVDVYYNESIDDSIEYMVATANEHELKKFQLFEGDVLITKDSEDPHDIAVPALVVKTQPKLLCGYHLSIIRSDNRNCSGPYIFWALRDASIASQLHREATGITRWAIANRHVKNSIIPLPPETEQKAIASYLDKTCAAMDKAVEAKQKQIETLDALRKSIIHKAVTRGLDDSVELKDSGVEWLGRIPKHWRIEKLKRLLSQPLMYGTNEAAEIDDPEYPRYIRITDFGDNGTLKPESFKSLPPDKAEGYYLEEGDLLFARSGATVGKSFLFSHYKGLACFAGYLIRARTNKIKLLPQYLYYFTKSPAYFTWKNVIFTQATIQNISATKYAYLPVSVPSVDEQQLIIQHLDKKMKSLDNMQSNLSDQISTLEQYRKSLIHECVTGKRRSAG